MRACAVLTLLVASLCLGQPPEKRVDRDVRDPEIVDAAKFAMDELKGLSDSGIYQTLELDRIVEAKSGEGIFHNNIFLRVVLKSPYLKDGAESATHDVMVMTATDAPNDRSFAIDEFPVMDDDAVEAFWISHVEKHREERERAFAEMDAAVESVLPLDDAADGRRDPASPVFPEDLQRIPTGQLIERTQHDTCPPDERAVLQHEIDRRYESKRLEQLLGKRPTRELRKMRKSENTPDETKEAISRILEDRLQKLEAMEEKKRGRRERSGGSTGRGTAQKPEPKDEL